MASTVCSMSRYDDNKLICLLLLKVFALSQVSVDCPLLVSFLALAGEASQHHNVHGASLVRRLEGHFHLTSWTSRTALQPHHDRVVLGTTIS
jgi:hypothetical protein